MSAERNIILERDRDATIDETRNAGEIITPGELILVATDNDYDLATGGPGSAQHEVIVAIEQLGVEATNLTIDEDYAVGDQVRAYRPKSGERFLAFLLDGETIEDGDALGLGATAGRLIEVPDVTGEQVLTFQIVNPAAGADITERAEFLVPASMNGMIVRDVQIVSQGTPTGIDDSNTSVITVSKIGTGTIATDTFDSTTAFPAENVAFDLGTITNGVLATGDIIGITILQGTTADPPAFIVHVAMSGSFIVGYADEDLSPSGADGRIRVRRA